MMVDTFYLVWLHHIHDQLSTPVSLDVSPEPLDVDR
jgi:hypothetical protein